MGKQTDFIKLKDGIKKYSPVVAEFFGRDDEIIDYSRSLYNYSIGNIHQQRQSLLVDFLFSYIKRVFGRSITVKPPLICNIVDHHAILNHPILMATNIVSSANFLFNSRRPIISLTSSIVPPNNFFNKKGFDLNGKRVPLFSNHEMHQATCFIAPRKFDPVVRLQNIGLWNNFNVVEQKFLNFIEGEVNNLPLSKLTTYNDQVSIIDAFLWKQIFHESIRNHISDLYYIPQENIVCYCMPYVLMDSDNLITRSLFDKDYRNLILLKFEGIAGCWDIKNGKGTHFFWYRTKNNEIGRMLLKDEILQSVDGSFKIKMEPAEIIYYIKNNTLIPSLFIIFSYLTFWCNVKPLVGHGSSNYLSLMKNAWLDILSKLNLDEYNLIKNIDTKGLIGGAIVTFRRGPAKELLPQYAFDVMLQGGLTEDYLTHIIHMKFKELLAPALLEIYESYVPIEKRTKLNLQPQDIVGKEFDWIK